MTQQNGNSRANLIPFNQSTPEELKALSRKGGIASGEARRKKREKIEAEKLKDKAIQEQHRENIENIKRCSYLLLTAKRELCADTTCPYYRYHKHYKRY